MMTWHPNPNLLHPLSLSLSSSSNHDSPREPKTQISSPNPISDLAWFSLIAACVKLLLIPSYHSTDFEVHRHWLALTHSLSLPNWYSDKTSPWTLDYPPFFAHFERFLSLFAKLVDPTIVDLHNGLNYKTPSVIIFQRLTVILSDTVLIYGIYRLGRKLGSRERNLIWVLVVWSPALLIVDHMHFQYNGFLMGILLVSLSLLEEGRDLTGGEGWVRAFGRLVAMGTVVVAVFVAAYGPFVYYGRIQQVFHRMFPFGRGLCHAYWAPNFWVFYILLDKGLAFMLAKLGFNIQAPTASFTGGLVGDTSPFAVLPRVTPLITFVLVLIALFPCLIKAWRSPQPRMITRWVAYAYTCGFLFGWHVHEKASLHFVIPLDIVATQGMEDARHYFILSIVSCYSLFPLLFEAQEYPIKVLLLLLHSILMWFGFSSQFSQITSAKAQAGPGKK
ncbi:Dolichyl pyrophosphate Glc1Man9GlcNAc2 alpha-1,3-glucosyltransferase [Actinidia chinensis var. chinensis]|uniref:Alpha-1,3-glucosyltransferase n=1 Tax=Actinidia chinensis var. chinensis TaxID=1590841 RepID=A0A2R6QPL6_ACTCC|nr:Dolichyl pyrophosphate Glc1Man9GlcNAc2 alpha-1,3-glucosyltransferase [Actinidia chinensis var. chinensis]